ncbi:Tmh18p KNAG_0A07480 [Huiozyma naganishii CBS 8797]|uniref:TMEM205-like domain-containing protein n=1 Tax=Huiozyma naganishii (strain ATCC MYA-139 / BCRC 22969 / CBS 8797 / KCTC 17520 / NBRC 10181 / NCYC 3082 / Yp74L-3) TaxID=1071383 RepID=J7S458_HUIN7|nr:hypothetical protein KNAG_0A07480 [Kazachstania naganishii CBS 8797]CCK68401.1 hypothetical protein KNAG_0A07480 [Kazachstania naganishii CBS 8797]
MSLVKPTAHLLVYSFAFGGTAFYSYVASPIAFKVLARDQFSLLQNKVFPWFFRMQASVPVLLALTSPVQLSLLGCSSLGAAAVCGLTNLAWLLPRTQRVKLQRRELQTAQLSPAELEARDAPLRKEFGKSHGLSLAFNMGNTLAMLVYGVHLAGALIKYIPK